MSNTLIQKYSYDTSNISENIDECVVVDLLQNIYFLESLHKTSIPYMQINFGNFTQISSPLYIIKYDGIINQLVPYKMFFPSPSEVVVYKKKILIDSSDNIYIYCSFTITNYSSLPSPKTIRVDNSINYTGITGANNVVLIKLNNTGNIVWYKFIENTSLKRSINLLLDEIQNKLYISYVVDSGTNVKNPSGTILYNEQRVVYHGVSTSNGNFDWSLSLKCDNPQNIKLVGNLYQFFVVGFDSSNVLFRKTNTLNYSDSLSLSQPTIWIRRFDPAGNMSNVSETWPITPSTLNISLNDNYFNVHLITKLNGQGNIYITYSTYNPNKVIIEKYTTHDRNFIFRKEINVDFIYNKSYISMLEDSNDNLFVLLNNSYYNTAISFDNNLNRTGGIYFIKYSPDGTQLWVKRNNGNFSSNIFGKNNRYYFSTNILKTSLFGQTIDNYVIDNGNSQTTMPITENSTFLTSYDTNGLIFNTLSLNINNLSTVQTNSNTWSVSNTTGEYRISQPNSSDYVYLIGLDSTYNYNTSGINNVINNMSTNDYALLPNKNIIRKNGTGNYIIRIDNQSISTSAIDVEFVNKIAPNKTVSVQINESKDVHELNSSEFISYTPNTKNIQISY